MVVVAAFAMTGVAVVTTASPASADSAGCTVTNDPTQDRWDFQLSTAGWIIEFVDGVKRSPAGAGDQPIWINGASVILNQQTLASNGGTNSIEFRWYDPAVVPQGAGSSITSETPYACHAVYSVQKQVQVISIGWAGTPWYVGGVYDMSAAASSGLPVTVTSETPEVCSVSSAGGFRVTGLAEGDCKVSVTQQGDATFEPATVASTHHINARKQAKQSLTFAALADANLDDLVMPRPVVRTDAGLTFALSSVTPEVCGVAAGVINAVTAGTCTIRAVGSGGIVGDTEYAPADPVDVSFTIAPRAGTNVIDFPAPDATSVAARTVQLGASATSGLPVLYASRTEPVCTVSPAGLVQLHAPGTCTITTSQAGGMAGTGLHVTSYPAAAPVTRSFTVESVGQQISVHGVPAGVALSSRTVTASFTSSSGAPVNVVSKTPGVCVWSGGRVQLRAAGTCVLDGSVAASGDYLAAVGVTASFPVWAAPKVPAAVNAPQALTVLGKGEDRLQVTASPRRVCVPVEGGEVVVFGAGTCRIAVTSPSEGGRHVRASRVKVAPVAGAGGRSQLRRAAAVTFAYKSAALTAGAKDQLRKLAPRLRAAEFVVIYGNTQAHGAGDTAANRALSKRRAAAVAKYLRHLHVKAKVAVVPVGARNPVKGDDIQNRRADIYWLK
ncbi:OmpA family protein [Nocardioides sp. CER19]|uniref:OmpA family protein n=1 Tax=Nocardioides sp. CER19 TaxID=3038538 RepID=UPI00244AEE3B|nr:OmpA family protein [Nocardioides sp. CER19]MDH2413846.1 OmpA family protein [Nocardioides sp. CER19]